MICQSFRSSGSASRTALFTAVAPRLPPMTIRTGLSAENPVSFSAASRLPSESSLRMGQPVRTAFFGGRYCRVSGKLQHTFAADGMVSLLARPGVKSDSWQMTGICLRPAAITTGTDTKPPLENTTSGFNSFISFFASLKPLITRNGSEKLRRSK